MKKYRTAQGKPLDMASLIARNERVRAVGNMNVNARGDTIDATGKIITPVTQKVGDKYAKTVGNRSAQVKKPVPPKVIKPPIKQSELTNEEIELENSVNDDLEVEAIKARENKQ